jgi:heme exporter protein D
MSVWLIIGLGLAAWAVLSVLGGERERLAQEAARHAADEARIKAAKSPH